MTYFGYGKKVDFDLDASPWRGELGGLFRINDRFVAYFSDPLSSEEVARFEHPVGASSGLQTWECLEALVALRMWLAPHREVRVCLRVRSDSTTALRLLLTLKASGAGPSFLSRELALDLALGSYRPDVGTHVPEDANVGPDALLRMMTPGSAKELPPYLRSVERVFPASALRVFLQNACAHPTLKDCRYASGEYRGQSRSVRTSELLAVSAVARTADSPDASAQASSSQHVQSPERPGAVSFNE